MRVIGSGHVYDAAAGPPHGRVCAHTTISLLHDGTVLVAFRRGSARDSLDGHVCVYASTDQGETWELRHDGVGLGAWDGTPGEVKCLAIAELTPGVLTGTSLWVDRSRPELPWISPQTQGLLPMRVFHTTSTDGGRTWGHRRAVPTAPHAAASPCSSSVLALPDGVLAQPYEHWKAYDDRTTPRPGARLRLSSDAGATWPEYVTVAVHPDAALYYWDQRLGRHPDTGRLVAMFWTHNATAGEDRDIHIAWGAPDGRSWTQPVGTGLPGQHCQPLPVGGDRLVAVYAHRAPPPWHPRRPQPGLRPHLGPHPRSCGVRQHRRDRVWHGRAARSARAMAGYARLALRPPPRRPPARRRRLGGLLRWRRCCRRCPLGTPAALNRETFAKVVIPANAGIQRSARPGWRRWSHCHHRTLSWMLCKGLGGAAIHA